MQRISLTAVARRRLSFLVLIVVSVLGAIPAFAADPKIEKEVQSLQKKAIEEDNLNVNYAGAIKKLQLGVAKCDGDKCSPALKAAVNRDLGAMQILNGAVDDGKASFGVAIGLDAIIELDPAYKNPQLEGIWAEVKKKGGAPSAATGTTPAKAGPQPTGDFVHSPPTEAQVRTPLPIYVEYSGTEELSRVTAKYKGFGMTDWRTIELAKLDSGFGALIPCKDVTQGQLQYFVQGFTSGNDPVATSGSRTTPFTVPVSATISGPVPSLPGREPPAQCQDTGECPPDFPGCGTKKAAGEECAKDTDCDSASCVSDKCADKKAVGDDCESDSECNSGSCSDKKCAGKKGDGDDCESDEDCDSNQCKDSKCTAPKSVSGKPSKIWLGIGGQADIYFLPGADDVCKEASNGTSINGAGYTCVNGGSAFPGSSSTRNSEIVKGLNDQVVGGLKLGNIRLLASLDYAVGRNVLVGLRAGYVLNTDPVSPPFAPIHVEGRVTYVIGKDALTKKGLSPMVFVGAGAGEFDAAVPVTVNLKASPMQTTAAPNTGGSVDSWITAGPVFLTVGGGARVLVSPKVAITAAVKLEGALGGAAGFLPGVAPELGLQFGL